MAAWGIQAGTAIGRGFDSNGLLGLFKDWVVKSPSNHGPGWYLIDDQSALGSNPYIIVADKPQPWVQSSWPKIVRLLLPSATAGYVQFASLLYYDLATKALYAWYYSYLRTFDAVGFPYWFRGGPEALGLITWPGGDAGPSHAIIDEFEGDANYLEPQTKSGTANSDLYLEAGDTGNLLSGYHNITGLAPGNIDAGGVLYFSIILVSGSTYLIRVYKDSARTQLVGHTANFTNTATGAKTIIADNSSGLAGTVNVDATVSATASISCRVLRMTLGAGEGANITVGQRYYIIDYSEFEARVSYSKVESKSGDTIELSSIRPGMAFKAGSYISPYPMRHYCLATRTHSATGQNLLGIPLMSRQSNEYASTFANSYPSHDLSVPSAVITAADPDDNGIYRISRGIISERTGNSGDSTGMNRELGRPKNMVTGSPTLITVMQNGRSSGGIDYVSFVDLGSTHRMIRDTESVS